MASTGEGTENENRVLLVMFRKRNERWRGLPRRLVKWAGAAVKFSRKFKAYQQKI